jgi:hypothetical protein
MRGRPRPRGTRTIRIVATRGSSNGRARARALELHQALCACGYRAELELGRPEEAPSLGGDSKLTISQEMSIDGLDHMVTHLRLYGIESLTFQVISAQGAVPLRDEGVEAPREAGS